MAGKLPFMPKNVGKWWSANEEIDLVVLGETDAILVECKWTSRPAGVDILADLERKAGLVKSELGERHIQFGLCSRSGFTRQLDENLKQRHDVKLLNLPELIGEKTELMSGSFLPVVVGVELNLSIANHFKWHCKCLSKIKFSRAKKI